MSKILVVDDESNMRFLLRMTLEPEGFEIVEAHHGVEALKRVHAERPDLIVTDLMMPVMNGRELIRQLRSSPETASIPIVVLSSGENLELEGADAFLSKPIDLDALIDTARSFDREDAA